MSDNLIQFSHGGYGFRQILISETDTAIDVNLIEHIIPKFDNGKCLGNSIEAARILNATCIEGVVECRVRNVDRTDYHIIRHCWNKIGDVHFDVTRDFIWDKSSRLKQFIYFPIAEYKPSEYVPVNGEVFFLSDAPKIAQELNSELNGDTPEPNKTDPSAASPNSEDSTK